MKILHLNSNYLYTTLFDKMVQNLEKRGIENTVFMPVNGKKSFVIQPRDFVYYPVAFNNIDRYFFYYKQLKIFNKLRNTLFSFSFDITHAHTLFTDGYSAYKLKKKYKIPYVVTVRNTDVNTFFKRIIHLRRLGIQILKNADMVVFLSETYKKMVIDCYVPNNMQKEINDKSRVIPNGIDEYWFQNKGTPKELSNKKSANLLHVGVINKNKNVLTTIKAIEILQNRGFNINFSVVGRIDDKSIYQQIKDIDFVTYIEPKSQEELISIYRKQDIFVMPSITETFGLVYAEAMSQGLPVVYTRGQGFDRQFKEGIVGHSVDCLKPVDIADKINDIIDNYEVISSNCISLCDKFEWKKISIIYEKLYSQVLEV